MKTYVFLLQFKILGLLFCFITLSSMENQPTVFLTNLEHLNYDTIEYILSYLIRKDKFSIKPVFYFKLLNKKMLNIIQSIELRIIKKYITTDFPLMIERFNDEHKNSKMNHHNPDYDMLNSISKKFPDSIPTMLKVACTFLPNDKNTFINITNHIYFNEKTTQFLDQMPYKDIDNIIITCAQNWANITNALTEYKLSLCSKHNFFLHVIQLVEKIDNKSDFHTYKHNMLFLIHNIKGIDDIPNANNERLLTTLLYTLCSGKCNEKNYYKIADIYLKIVTELIKAKFSVLQNALVDSDTEKNPIYQSPLEIVNSEKWKNLADSYYQYRYIKSTITHRARDIVEYLKNKYPYELNNPTLFITYEREALEIVPVKNNASIKAALKSPPEPTNSGSFMGYKLKKNNFF